MLDKFTAKKITKKTRKANKIISILNEFKNLNKCNVLDIGSGTGIIAGNLAKYFKKVYGADIIDNRIIKKGYLFKKVSDEILPFKDKFFDVIISNQIIEHVNDQERHLSEINRVLKKKGICYLATPNKYWPIEPHYYLPFLSVMPKKIANLYLRLFKNKDYDAILLSHKQLYKKASKYFKIIDFTPSIIKNPKKYHLEKKFRFFSSIVGLLPNPLIRYTTPSFVFLLKKKE